MYIPWSMYRDHMAILWRIGSFFLYMDSEDQAQVDRLVQQALHLHPLSHLASPQKGSCLWTADVSQHTHT